jgi:hypothetical protein
MMRALEAWCHFLLGNPHPIIVFTDHKNLTYFRSAQWLTCRQARWHCTLLEYDLSFQHVPGKDLSAPDALSRRPDHSSSDNDNADVTLLPDSFFLRLIDNEFAAAFRSTDPLANPVIVAASAALTNGSPPPMRSSLDDWRLEDGVLFFKDCTYVPPHLCK